MAGLSEHVDFFELSRLKTEAICQISLSASARCGTPHRFKGIGEPFLQAVELEPGADQEALLVKHARAMKARISS